MVAKGEEIGIAGIAGDNQVGLRSGREGQHCVIRGIAADWCRQRRRDRRSRPTASTHKRLLGIDVGAGHDRLELWTIHDLGEFGQQRRAADQG